MASQKMTVILTLVMLTVVIDNGLPGSYHHVDIGDWLMSIAYQVITTMLNNAEYG